MPLKENLSKLAKSVGDGATTVAKKSTKMVEVTKLNLNIQSEEDKIQSSYSEIGLIIYKKYKKGEQIDSDLKYICEGIEKSESNICSLKQKILDIKKVKLCKDCGNELQLDVIFCPKCGCKQNV